MSSGCSTWSGILPLSKSKATPTPSAATPKDATATPIASDDAALEAAARAIVEAMALVNYQDPIPWKNKLLALSGDDGKKFWQLNFDNLLKDVVARQRIAEKVTVERVVVLEKQSRTDTQGKSIAGAGVLVTGRIAYSDDAGKHEDPINQPLLLGNLDGQWKFIALIPPTALTPVAPAFDPERPFDSRSGWNSRSTATPTSRKQ